MDAATRLEVYNSYGTASRALWTMFTVTLGSQGTAPAGDLAMMHWSYAIFFAAYVLCVGFAVICIIEALFLKDTLKMAAKDADMLVQEHLDTKRETFKRIHDLFIDS